MSLGAVLITVALFIAYLPYKIILKKFKIQIDTDKDSKKIWFFKAIIYWSNFFLVCYIFKSIINIF